MRRSAGTAIAVLLVALGLLRPSSAWAQPPFIGSEFQVNTFTLLDQQAPRVDCGDDGISVVTWVGRTTDNPGNSRTAFVTRYDSAGTKLGPDFEFPTGRCAASRSSTRVCRNSTRSLAVWREAADGQLSGVFGQFFDNAGALIGTEFLVNTYTPGNQLAPDIACTGTGEFVVVWESYQDGDGSKGIFGQRFDSIGAPAGGEFQVNTYTPSLQRTAAVAANLSGAFVVTWAGIAASDPNGGVFAQRYASDGAPQGSEFRVNANTIGNQVNPAVGVADDGSFVVVWGDSPSIRGARFNSSGAALGTEFQVNSVAGFVTGASVASGPTGEFAVAWAADPADGDSQGVVVRRFDSSGAAIGSEFLVNSYTTGAQRFPDIASSSNGDLSVTWTSRPIQSGTVGQDGSGDGVFAQRLSSTGTPLGGEFQVNQFTLGAQAGPGVGCNAAGSCVFGWTSASPTSPGGNSTVFLRHYDPTGVAQTGEIELDSGVCFPPPGHPDICRGTIGDFVVAYEKPDGSSDGIFAQRFDSSGTTNGAEFQVNATTTDDQLYPSIDCEADGDFVVAWHSHEQDGSSAGAFGRRFDSSGAPRGAEFQANTDTNGDQYYASVSVADDGAFVVVWIDDPDDEIVGRRFDSSGGFDGSEFSISQSSGNSLREPHVEVANNGSFVVVWSVGGSTSIGLDGDDDAALARRFDSTGSPLGNEFVVNSYTTGSQRSVVVSLVNDGSFLTAWEDFARDDTGLVAAQLFDSSGTPNGSEFQVNSYTTGRQYSPAICGSENGFFSVVWESDGQDGSALGVFGQNLGTPPPTVTSTATATSTATGTATATATATDTPTATDTDTATHTATAIQTPTNTATNPATHTASATATPSATPTATNTAQPDTDNDGVPDEVEDAGPNNGDGNGDTTPDSQQPDVSTLPDANGNPLTVSVGGGCAVLENVTTIAEETLANDPNYVYPFGLLGFTLPCQSADITVIYHGVTTVAAGTAYRKFGATPPAFAAAVFYNLPTTPPQSLTFAGNTATFTLTNGLLGDGTDASDGMIVDPGGPAIFTLAQAPVMSMRAVLTLCAVLAAIAFAAMRRRRFADDD